MVSLVAFCVFCYLRGEAIVRAAAVGQGGRRAVAIAVGTARTAGGATGRTDESDQILGVDRFVMLQHLEGIIDLEPLPLPSCENENVDRGTER